MQLSARDAFGYRLCRYRDKYKTETERIEATERQESNPVITASKEEKAEVPEKQEEAVQNDSSLQIQDDAGNGDSDTMDTFADANDMMKSADLSGTAGECSDTGCVINTSPFADGTSSSGDGGSMTVTYTEDTVFQKGTVKSDGSSYFWRTVKKDRIGAVILYCVSGNSRRTVLTWQTESL